MKRKTILFIVVILSVFINLNLVKAANIKIAGGNIEPGASLELDVTIEGEDLKDYGKLEFSLQVDPDDDVTIDNLKAYAGNGYTFRKNENTFIFEIPTDKEEIKNLSEGKVGTILITTSEELDADFRITPINVKLYKLDGTLGEKAPNVVVGTVKYTVPKSTEAFLTGLALSTPTNSSLKLTPSFDSEKLEYLAIVDDTVGTVKINATPCANAKVTTTGSTRLVMGDNKFKITVTAEDGKTTKDYTVNVVKVKPSAYLVDLYVDNIGLGEISPEFEKNNNKYTIHVPKNVSSLNFKYVLEDEYATVKEEGNKNFVPGENVVTFTVTSSDGKLEQVYEVTVLKESDKESSGEVIPPLDEDLPSQGQNPSNKAEKEKPKYWLIAVLGVSVIGVTIGIVILLFKKKKNKKKRTIKTEAKPTLTKEEFESKPDIAKVQEELTKTTTYNQKDFKDPEKLQDLEKTKEFNFKDFM